MNTTSGGLGEYDRFRAHKALRHAAGAPRTDCPPCPRSKERYLRVSVPWLRWATAGVKGKSAVLTALVLAHVCGLTRSSTVEVKRTILKDFGLSRQGYYRGLAALERSGVIRVERRPGKRVVVELLSRPP